VLRAALIVIALLLCYASVQAQDDEPSTALIYGGRITGIIGTQQPRAAYFFDGLRGEVVSIGLRATSGDLDPILLLLDASGRVITKRDDSNGERHITINAITIPQSGRYYVVVGRFGMGLGSTNGNFELDIERIGVSGESGSALRYGDSVINNITNMTPQVYYSFRAEQGDIVNITMLRNSGNLDPYLQVVDSTANVIADNDDLMGSGSLDAGIIGLVIQQSGTYVVVATRYGEAAGTSSGRFILTLQEAENSGLGNAAQTALLITSDAPAEDEINNNNPLKYYQFNGRQDDIITLRLSRTSGSLDAFLILLDANLQEITSDDDSGGGQNAQISSYRIPADGVYYVVATRLDREQGTTTGRYRLEFQALGNAFDGVPEGMQRIGYGTTITGRVDDITSEVVFAFFGQEGEPITVSMNRGDGDLDPVVAILDSDQNVVAQDDDSGGGQNARIARFVLPRSGLYFIRATRFSGTDGNPNTQGSFILVLARIAR